MPRYRLVFSNMSPPPSGLMRLLEAMPAPQSLSISGAPVKTGLAGIAGGVATDAGEIEADEWQPCSGCLSLVSWLFASQIAVIRDGNEVTFWANGIALKRKQWIPGLQDSWFLAQGILEDALSDSKFWGVLADFLEDATELPEEARAAIQYVRSLS